MFADSSLTILIINSYQIMLFDIQGCLRNLIYFVELNKLPLNAKQASIVSQYHLDSSESLTKSLSTDENAGSIDATDTLLDSLSETTTVVSTGRTTHDSIADQERMIAGTDKRANALDITELTRERSPLQMEARDVQFHPLGKAMHRIASVLQCRFVLHLLLRLSSLCFVMVEARLRR